MYLYNDKEACYNWQKKKSQQNMNCYILKFYKTSQSPNIVSSVTNPAGRNSKSKLEIFNITFQNTQIK